MNGDVDLAKNGTQSTGVVKQEINDADVADNKSKFDESYMPVS